MTQDDGARRKSYRSLFCPECGREVDELYEGVCEDCLQKHVELMHCPLVLEMRQCPKCGAYPMHGVWHLPQEKHEGVLQLVRDSIMIHKDVQDEELELSVIFDDGSLIRVHVDVGAVVAGASMQGAADVEVRVAFDACDVCSRIAGGYYEGIVQIRAEDRLPTDEERQTCVQLAENVSEKLRDRDPMAFISKIEELKEGVDLYVGSKNTATRISKAITGEFGGGYSSSPKLVGERDGKKLYRVSFSVRLPRITQGDVIHVDGKTVLVEHSDTDVTGVDLEAGGDVTVKKNRLGKAELLGRRDDARKTFLTMKGEDEVQILDPDNYNPVNIRKPSFLNAPEGSEINVIKTKKGVFILPGELN